MGKKSELEEIKDLFAEGKSNLRAMYRLGLYGLTASKNQGGILDFDEYHEKTLLPYVRLSSLLERAETGRSLLFLSGINTMTLENLEALEAKQIEALEKTRQWIAKRRNENNQDRKIRRLA
jgi:hypothetical protein